MIELAGKGLSRFVGGPEYGKQDRGFSPGGAQDRFSFASGNIILGNPENEPAFEFVFQPAFHVVQNGAIIFTGAPLEGSRIVSDGRERIALHGSVYDVRKGDILVPGARRLGFRSYLQFRPCTISVALALSQRERGDYNAMATFPDPRGRIRVMAGPEMNRLISPTDFFKTRYVTSRQMSDMGIRLEGETLTLSAGSGQMVSRPVADGTIQMTVNGPIILMRNRQTVGGYPRIFNIISPDMDLVAQFGPGQHIRFEMVDAKEALRVNRLRENDLSRFRLKFGNIN